MELTHAYGLMHFLLKNNVGYESEVMMLTRDVIDLLNHTTSTCVIGCLLFVVVNGVLMIIY